MTRRQGDKETRRQGEEPILLLRLVPLSPCHLVIRSKGMRLLVTSDLHFNHPGSRPVAEELIRKINRTGGDALALIGDTAVLQDQELEHCLGRIRFRGEKLFVAGNHELWTHGADS